MFVLSSLSGGPLVEFWWCLKPQDPLICTLVGEGGPGEGVREEKRTRKRKRKEKKEKNYKKKKEKTQNTKKKKEKKQGNFFSKK